MKGIYYSRMMVLWFVLGMLLLDGSLLYMFLSTPFDYLLLFLGWLFVGLNCLAGFGLSLLWHTDITEI
jgi:hypothetical protein